MQKSISSLINLNQKTKKRDRLFYDKYEYSVEFYLPTATLLREFKKGNFRRENIPTMFHHRAALYNAITSKKFKFLDTDYQDERNIELTQHTYDILTKRQAESLVSFRSKFITVYTNDLSIIDEINGLYANFEYLPLDQIDRPLTLSQCILDRPRNTIRRRNLDYKYRIMLRHKICPQWSHVGLRKFIETYERDIRVSNALKKHLEPRMRWSNNMFFESNHYIEVNDEKLKTILDMLAPGVSGEVLEIIPYK